MKLIAYVAPASQIALTLPKQEAIVLRAIRDQRVGTPERIAERCLDLGLQTRQDPVRIVEYYVSDLVKRGLVEVSGAKRGAKRVVVVLDAAAPEESDAVSGATE